jgi:hypothetical protein
MLFTYDPAGMLITFKGILITGFADGTFLNVERNEDGWFESVGADGHMIRTRNRNLSGVATLTLQQSSPANDLLLSLAQTDELTGLGVGPFMAKDINGTTMASSPQGWCRKRPGIERGKESGNTEWIIAMSRLDLKAGSAFVIG